MPISNLSLPEHTHGEHSPTSLFTYFWMAVYLLLIGLLVGVTVGVGYVYFGA